MEVDLLSLFLILISCIFNIWDITRVFSIILLVFAFYRAFSKTIQQEEKNTIYSTLTQISYYQSLENLSLIIYLFIT